MNSHANAKTCPNSRELFASRVIEQGLSYSDAAEAVGVSKRTVAKWVPSAACVCRKCGSLMCAGQGTSNETFGLWLRHGSRRQSRPL
jgi:transposase